MPGPISHILIGDKLLKKIDEKIRVDKGLFYAGALAPDAIHAREGYIREYKKRTHFRTDIRDVDFHKKESQLIFHKRIDQFITKYLNHDDEKWSLHFGYLVHVLSDESLLLTIRQEFNADMRKENIEQSDKEFLRKITHDLNSNENNLYKGFGNIQEIRKLIEDLGPYEIKGYIREDEILTSRNWVFSTYFKDNKMSQPIYISYKRYGQFINETVDMVMKRLSDGICFQKVLK